MNLREALIRIADLEERLTYFNGRGQLLMDLAYKQIMGKLERADPDEMTPAFLTTCTRFLKDQAIVDLKPGGAVRPKSLKGLPFSVPDEGDDDNFGSKAAEA
jgi:hypothetical protein